MFLNSGLFIDNTVYSSESVKEPNSDGMCTITYSLTMPITKYFWN
jgi:hypothetical protein